MEEALRVMVMVVRISFIQPKIIRFEPQETTKLLFGIKLKVWKNHISL